MWSTLAEHLERRPLSERLLHWDDKPTEPRNRQPIEPEWTSEWIGDEIIEIGGISGSGVQSDL